MTPERRKIKVLLAQFSLETHSRGIITVAGMLRDSGMEVVYIGNNTPEQIMEAAVHEDVDVVGISSYCGGELALGADLMEAANKRGAKDRIYKLSAIAHYFVQGKIGSAFDVAASTYGGVFVYQRFDPKWLEEKLNSGQGVREIVDQDWPAFRAEPLEIPEGFRLIIGWTKESASTSAMVKQLNTWAEGNREEYKRLYDQIANLVRELIPAWKDKNKERILELVRKNEGFLKELGEASGVNIETPDLKMLSESANQAGAAGKLSGAGGGDCGIAVCFDSESAEKVKNGWEEKEFYLVDATIDYNGVKAE